MVLRSSESVARSFSGTDARYSSTSFAGTVFVAAFMIIPVDKKYQGGEFKFSQNEKSAVSYQDVFHPHFNYRYDRGNGEGTRGFRNVYDSCICRTVS